MTIYEEIGKRVRALAGGKGLSQKELGAIIGSTGQAVGKKYIADGSSFRIDELMTLADYFNVSLLYLLQGEKSIAADGLSEEAYEVAQVYERLPLASRNDIHVMILRLLRQTSQA